MDKLCENLLLLKYTHIINALRTVRAVFILHRLHKKDYNEILLYFCPRQTCAKTFQGCMSFHYLFAMLFIYLFITEPDGSTKCNHRSTTCRGHERYYKSPATYDTLI